MSPLPRTITLGLAMLGLATPTGADIVHRRGADPPVRGEVTAIGEAGIEIRSEHGAVFRITWDRVRRVDTDRTEPSLPRWLALATDLWRARARVERGDTRLAEPLLERLFETLSGQTNATALVVAEGLLRCRLDRGAHATAVVPALETARLRRAGHETTSYATLEPVLDADTSLCRRLAPAWVDARGLRGLEQDLAGYDAQGDEVVAAMAALYRRSVRQHLGLPVAESDPDVEAVARTHAGVAWLLLNVGCHDPDPRQRETARNRLSRQTETMPPWAEPWTWFAVGTSRLRESGVGRQQRGMVDLIHLPARFTGTNPYLAGLALARVEAASLALGDADTAAVVRTELERTFPNHPARSRTAGPGPPKTPKTKRKDAP